MRINKELLLILPAILSLALLPAYADVTTLETDKLIYSNVEKIIFSGMENEGNTMVTLVINDPSNKKVILKGDPSSGHDGAYQIVPIAINDVFDKGGVYKVYAFSSTQPVLNATTMNLDYDGRDVRVVSVYDLKLKPIEDKTINEGQQYSFFAKITDNTINEVEYSLGANAPEGAEIDTATGKITWTPAEAQGPGSYRMKIIVRAGISTDSQTIIITVNEVPDPVIQKTQKDSSKPAEKDDSKSMQEPQTPQKKLGVASFVDQTKDPQHYVDRYNNEEQYKKWFDANFAQYSSIYEAVGLGESVKLASFVDPKKDPQYYVDRYNTEDAYKGWFDANFAQYSSIYEAVGLEEPAKLASFVDPKKDPQYYVDRYNDEDEYKGWFDANFAQYSTIYEAVGLEEPVTLAPFVDKTRDPQYYVDRYNSEKQYKGWFDANFAQYSTIYEAVGLPEPDVGICGKGTELTNGTCTVTEVNNQNNGCLIATAAYGSEMSPQVQMLREIRDDIVLQTESGSTFMSGFNQFYYSFSPTIADWQRQNPVFKEAIKITITPLLASLAVLNHVDIDSEYDMLGAGIGIMMMNVGMYFVVPAAIIYKIRAIAPGFLKQSFTRLQKIRA